MPFTLAQEWNAVVSGQVSVFVLRVPPLTKKVVFRLCPPRLLSVPSTLLFAPPWRKLNTSHSNFTGLWQAQQNARENKRQSAQHRNETHSLRGRAAGNPRRSAHKNRRRRAAAKTLRAGNRRRFACNPARRGNLVGARFNACGAFRSHRRCAREHGSSRSACRIDPGIARGSGTSSHHGPVVAPLVDAKICVSQHAQR